MGMEFDQVSTRVVVVKAVRDLDAGVWYVESSDLAGLNVEAETVEELIEKLRGAVADLIDCETDDGSDLDVPIELIAHASTRTRTSRVA